MARSVFVLNSALASFVLLCQHPTISEFTSVTLTESKAYPLYHPLRAFVPKARLEDWLEGVMSLNGKFVYPEGVEQVIKDVQYELRV